MTLTEETKTKKRGRKSLKNKVLSSSLNANETENEKNINKSGRRKKLNLTIKIPNLDSNQKALGNLKLKN